MICSEYKIEEALAAISSKAGRKKQHNKLTKSNTLLKLVFCVVAFFFLEKRNPS